MNITTTDWREMVDALAREVETPNSVLVEMLAQLMRRVEALEEACAGQVRNHEFQKMLAGHRGDC